MTQEQLEYNKLCAEFVGRSGKVNKHLYWVNIEGVAWVTVEEMKFHSDWNWIMSVVEAVLNKCDQSPSFREAYRKWVCEARSNPDFLIFIYDRQELVIGIHQFLAWYNQSKTKTA